MGADFELTLTRRITVQLAESDALAVYASKAELETSVRVNDELQGACVVEGQVRIVQNKVHVYLDLTDELVVLNGDTTSVQIEPIESA